MNISVWLISWRGIRCSDKERVTDRHRKNDWYCLPEKVMRFFSSGKDSPVDLLLLAGRPFNEQIAGYGLLVMNTRKEILEAFQSCSEAKW